MMSSPQALPDTGQPSTIFAGPSIKATPPSGLPPYNGGLFDRKRIPLLTNIRLGDDVMAKAIDALSFEQTPNGRRYINYRDLGVQQLGSIYERLLEQEIVRDGSEIAVRPNVFARKGSGSYYTPDDLVGLIIKETIGPLVRLSMDNFTAKHSEHAGGQLPEDRRISRLKQLDPAGETSGIESLRSRHGLGTLSGQPRGPPSRPG